MLLLPETGTAARLLRVITLLLAWLGAGVSHADDLPSREQLHLYEATINALQSGQFVELPPALANTDGVLLDLARLLLEQQHPEAALALLDNKEAGVDSQDPLLSELHRLRAAAWRQLGENRKARIAEISMLEALRNSLGYNQPAFLTELDRFYNYWVSDATVNSDDLKSLVTWLRRKPPETVSSLVAEEAPAVVDVWFGTNRKPTGSADPFGYFGSDIDELQVGLLKVTIPPNHKRSIIETPAFWQRSDNPDPRKHIVLESITPLKRDVFAKGCCAAEDKLLFIHGYNVSFHDGALRAAQLAYDLEFSGRSLYYSWPSQGTLMGYLSDANNVVPSRPSLIAYLELVTRGPGKLHIIAHSMGNRYLLEALEIFLRDYPDRTIAKIVFAAPDVDHLEFEVRLQSLMGRVGGLTLYSSDSDRALQISKKVNGRPRAGDAGEFLLSLKGITTIDASGIGGDSLKHSYFADTDLVLADLLGDIRLNWPPTQRCSIQQSADESWRIVKNGCRVGPLLAATRLIREYRNKKRAKAQLEAQRSAAADNKKFWAEVLDLLDNLNFGK